MLADMVLSNAIPPSQLTGDITGMESAVTAARKRTRQSAIHDSESETDTKALSKAKLHYDKKIKKVTAVTRKMGVTAPPQSQAHHFTSPPCLGSNVDLNTCPIIRGLKQAMTTTTVCFATVLVKLTHL